MRDHVGIGFIGSGFARRVQAPAFSSVPGARLIGCSSPNHAGPFGREFNMPVITTNWKDLIAHDDIQLVCITSTPDHHYEQAMYSIEHGKHVLCEKPFALTSGQAKSLWEASLKAGTLCLLDHELRFTPAVKYLKSKLEKYDLGEIFFATAASDLTFRNNADHPFNWWSEKSKGGGSWGAIGSHLIDLLRHLVDEISAADTTLTTGYKKRKDANGKYHEVTSDDIAASILRFRSGAGGMIYTSTASFETRFDIRIIGEKGTYTMDIHGNISHIDASGRTTEVHLPLTAHDEEILERYRRSNVPANKFSKAFFFYADAIVKAIRNEEDILQNAATFEDGYLTQQVLATGWEK